MSIFRLLVLGLVYIFLVLFFNKFELYVMKTDLALVTILLTEHFALRSEVIVASSQIKKAI